MTDLSLYKVDLDTPQPNGRSGESPRSAFTKYNDLIERIEGGVTGRYIGDSEPDIKSALMEWIDTSTSPAQIKRRNSQNTTWLTIGSYDQKLGTAAGATLPAGVTELKNTIGIETTKTPSANKIPQAEDNGKLNINWLGPDVFVRSESDMMTDRERMNQLYAASGMIHAGKHQVSSVSSAVNEGMWSFQSTTVLNSFLAGSTNTNGNTKGESATQWPVFHLSGITVSLLGLNRPLESAGAIFKLPAAPKGTEVYDTATGSLINFETDIDPKYGNIASSLDEAVKRAFGLVRLGDQGLAEVTPAGGDTTYDYVTQTAETNIYNNGVIFNNIPTNRNKLKARLTSDKTITVEIRDGSTGTTSSPVLHTVKINANEETTLDIELGDRTNNRIYFRLISIPSFPVKVKYTEVSVTNDVITHPVDLVGLELFLRPIDEDDPFVYPYGLQQQKLTSVDGITTVENNVRDITHFEVYPGDMTSRGRGWNLFNGSLSDQERTTILQNPAHSVYRMNDGTLVQWTVSQRTIRGPGNGDWKAISSNSALNLSFSDSSPTLRVLARGNLDARKPYLGSGASYYRGSLSASLTDHQYGLGTGIFTLAPNSGSPGNSLSYAVNGECYFYVIATVPRLNQGVWDPFRNPFGTATATCPSSINLNSISTNLVQHMAAVCYHFPSTDQLFAVGNGYGGNFKPGRYTNTGSIAESSSYNSIRPDKKLHDVIYDGGVNGIIDWRKPATEVSRRDDEAVKAKCLNGTYRGLTTLSYTKIERGSYLGSGSQTNAERKWGISSMADTLWLYRDGTKGYYKNLKVGDRVCLIDHDADVFISGKVISASDSVITCGFIKGVNGYSLVPSSFGTNSSEDSIYLITTFSSKMSVSGNYEQTDLICRPEELLSCIPSAQWLGHYITDLPSDVNKSCQVTRPPLKMNASYASTTKGMTWSSSSRNFVNATCSASIAAALGRLEFWHYDTWADMFKESTSLWVRGAYDGLMDVLYCSAYLNSYGRAMSFACMEKLTMSETSQVSGLFAAVGTLNHVWLDEYGRLPSVAGAVQNSSPSHGSIPLSPPANNSPGFKALIFCGADNKEAQLRVAWNEISSDGSTWNDDGIIRVSDKLSSYTNLNLQSLLCGCSALAISHGFTKNRARAGSQVLGVDL